MNEENTFLATLVVRAGRTPIFRIFAPDSSGLTIEQVLNCIHALRAGAPAAQLIPYDQADVAIKNLEPTFKELELEGEAFVLTNEGAYISVQYRR